MKERTVPNDLEKVGLEKALETAREFLTKLLGPATEEVGFMLKDKMRYYRLKNQIRILNKAQTFIHEAGLNPKAVPLRTLIPLLEGASLEDDELLANKWAALLANAAIDKIPEGNHPAFSRILSEMIPSEALLLDRLKSMGGEAPWESFRLEMAEGSSVSIERVNREYWNLLRNGIVRIGKKQNQSESHIPLTPFGQHFISACSHPT
jgi:hypothetical protein